jgi:two-component system, OmpR family, sensor kinase
VVSRLVLVSDLEQRVTTEMEQEVAEFRRETDGINPATGGPFGQDLAASADRYLLRNEPLEDEAVKIFVDGSFYASSSNAPYNLSEEPSLVNEWTSTAERRWGETDTPAGRARWLVEPIAIDGEVHGHFVVAQFPDDRTARLDRAVQATGVASLAVVAVLGFGAYLAMGRALRPLRAVTETARTIEETDLSRRIPVRGSDEVADLGRTFNAMVERLERAFSNQQTFLSDLGHELRTPLTIVRGQLEVMGSDPAEQRETLAVVTDELDRMSRMAEDLLLLAKAERPDFLRLTEVDVAGMMCDIHHKAAALGARNWVLGEVAPVTIQADPQRLTQALMQLVQNAVQFSEPGDRIELSATTSGDLLSLVVGDTGYGVEPSAQERIFERFAQAGHERAERAGLGLAIVAAIATAHRGTVTVASEPGAGSTFTLVIPMDKRRGGEAREQGAAG